MRTVFWEDDQLKMINQRRLPAVFEIVSFRDHRSVAGAIQDMTVRGAPAIGAAAAFGLALAGYESASRSTEGLVADLQAASALLKSARPTAVNLAWAAERVMRVAYAVNSSADDLRAAVLNEAQRIADEDVEINKRMAEHGAALIADGDTIIHHCNTGALATVDWGTALESSARRTNRASASTCWWMRPVRVCRARASPPGSWSNTESRTRSSAITCRVTS